MRLLAAALAVVGLGAVGCGGGTGGGKQASTTTLRAVAAPYALRPTAACLRSRGARVTNVLPTDRRLKALRDLAQRNSIEARRSGGVVALAFAKTAGDAELLAELLRVPDDNYRIIIRRNVVLFSPRVAPRALTRGIACLRT